MTYNARTYYLTKRGFKNESDLQAAKEIKHAASLEKAKIRNVKYAKIQKAKLLARRLERVKELQDNPPCKKPTRRVPGYRCLWATADGDIWSSNLRGTTDAGIPAKQLKQTKTSGGYMIVGCINLNTTDRAAFVHRLVYAAWVGKIRNNLEIDHINKIRNDNNHTNLRTITAKENKLNPTDYSGWRHFPHVGKSGSYMRVTFFVDGIKKRRTFSDKLIATQFYFDVVVQWHLKKQKEIANDQRTIC